MNAEGDIPVKVSPVIVVMVTATVAMVLTDDKGTGRLYVRQALSLVRQGCSDNFYAVDTSFVIVNTSI